MGRQDMNLWGKSMFLDQFFTEDNDVISITEEQASKFAKHICADFNPIHDPGTRRFCVPGDLLFALVLSKYGLSEKMSFKFTSMASAASKLYFPPSEPGSFTIKDGQGKTIIEVNYSGEKTYDTSLIEAMITRYAAFSGENFPTILLPLMEHHNVMFNPARPLVVYDSMWFKLENVVFADPTVELQKTELQVKRKRADQFLFFNFLSGGKPVGSGLKKVVLGGIKPYDKAQIKAFADGYESLRSTFFQTRQTSCTQ